MLQAIVLLTALDSPQDVDAQPQHVRIEEHADATEIVALDSSGAAIGLISVWVGSGVIHVDADYDDGYLHVELDGDRPIIDSNLDPDVARERALLLGAMLEPGLVPYGWGACAFAATGTIIAAATANPWVIGGAIASACSCLPVMVEEFEDLECPHW